MKLLFLLMSIAIATTPTRTAAGLQKRARFWKFGKKKTTTTVVQPLSRQNLAVGKFPAVATQTVALQTAAAVYSSKVAAPAVASIKLPTVRATKANRSGSETMAVIKPARSPEVMKNVAIRAKEAEKKYSAIVQPSCSEEFLQGKVLNGKYKVGKMIGEGGFSAVFYGSYGNEVVALKCLFSNVTLSGDDENPEVRILSTLDHPNLIKMLDTFVEGRLQFIVTEMCSSDLKAFISKRKTLDLPSAKKIMKQIADAIVYMHRHGIYHRDLKPDNILLKSMEELTVKVNDFGLSTGKYYAREIVGTYSYLAPEILEEPDENYEVTWEKNDVWGMGMIFFEMLTGKPPWETPMIPGYLVHDWIKEFGFSDQLVQFFNDVFSRSFERPSAEELRAGLDIIR